MGNHKKQTAKETAAAKKRYEKIARAVRAGDELRALPILIEGSLVARGYALTSFKTALYRVIKMAGRPRHQDGSFLSTQAMTILNRFRHNHIPPSEWIPPLLEPPFTAGKRELLTFLLVTGKLDLTDEPLLSNQDQETNENQGTSTT